MFLTRRRWSAHLGWRKLCWYYLGFQRCGFKSNLWLIINCAAERSTAHAVHQVLIHAINRNEAGCTVEVLPYISEAFDASKEIPETVVCPSLPFTYLSDLVWTDKAPDVVPEVHQAMRLLFPIPPVMFGPNIIGTIGDIRRGYTSASGSFTVVNEGRSYNGNADILGSKFDFHASASSSIYGASQTNQPASIRFFACIKF